MQKPKNPYSAVRGRPFSRNYSATLPIINIPPSSSLTMNFTSSRINNSSATSSPGEDSIHNGARFVFMSDHEKKLMGSQGGRMSSMNAISGRVGTVSLFVAVIASAFFIFSVFFSRHMDLYLFSSTSRKVFRTNYQQPPTYNSSSSSYLTSPPFSAPSSSKIVSSNNPYNSSDSFSPSNHPVSNNIQQSYVTTNTPASISVPDVNPPVKVPVPSETKQQYHQGLNDKPPDIVKPPYAVRNPSSTVIKPLPPKIDVLDKIGTSTAVNDKPSLPKVDTFHKIERPPTIESKTFPVKFDNPIKTEPSTNFESNAMPPKVDSPVKNTASSANANKAFSSKVYPYGEIGWNQSWPLTEQQDDKGLYRIARELKFTNRTLLNYFHLHKTGGVSVKAAITELLDRPENRAQLAKRGQPLSYIETCYKALSPISNVVVREVNWRCDFGQIEEMSSSELQSYDIVLGHQYWELGVQHFFGALRDIKYFSILRHPLSRKLSFYYHFFVRNAGAKEQDISREEVLDFVFGKSYDGDLRLRDGGNNYYASRFMSDGMSLFKKNRYLPSLDEEDGIITKIRSYLDNQFFFVGLQSQNAATNCMMEKTMQVFAHVHGIDTLVGSNLISEGFRKQLNAGQYPWTAKKLWASMSDQEKETFRQVERIDLAVYKRAVKRFRQSAKLFECEHLIDEAAFEEESFQ